MRSPGFGIIPFQILDFGLQIIAQGVLMRFDGTMLAEYSSEIDITYIENCAEAHLLAADRLGEHSLLRGQACFIGQEQPVNL